MDNNYNFKINQPPLKQADIEKHKDFDALLKRMENNPPPSKKSLKVVSRKIYFWLGGIAATLLIGLLALNNLILEEKAQFNQTASYLASQPYVNPPVKQLVKQVQTVSINANEGGVYQFPSGSKMVVPRSAFANAYGALIEGEVEIHFKEYHDYVDFFLSGIPMEIEVDGKAGVLESAGMIEVYATQDGERLQMLPEKPIDIELKSKIAFLGDTPPDFNIYYLDESERAWSLVGKDAIEVPSGGDASVDNPAILIRDGSGKIISEGFVKVIGDPEDPNFQGKVTYDTSFAETVRSLNLAKREQLESLDDKLATEIAQLTRQFKVPERPKKPEQYDGNSMTMELEFKGVALETAPYKGTIWQVMTPINAFGDFSTTVWENYDLQKGINDSFILNLSKGDKKATLKVKPVLVGKDFEQALKQFETQLANYQMEKEAAEKRLAAKKQEIRERITLEKELANKDFASRMAALKAKGHINYATNEIVKRTIINKFQINRFGTWNCDRPRPPYLTTLEGSFQDQHFQKYRNKIIYHTDKSQNTVRRFYLKDIAKVQFNQESDNLLWLVTETNKIATFPSDYFSRIQQTNGAYTFEMDLNSEEINSEADVRRILKL